MLNFKPRLLSVGLGAAALAAIIFGTGWAVSSSLHSDSQTIQFPQEHGAASVLTASSSSSSAAALSSRESVQIEKPFDGKQITPGSVALRFQEIQNLLNEVCRQKSNQPYFEKTPCSAKEMTDAQLADSSSVTPEQIEAAKRVFSQLADINQKTRQMMLASQQNSHVNAVHLSEKQFDPLVKENQEALLSGKISWGKYNSTRLQISRKIK